MNCLEDIVRVVETSAIANSAQLVGSQFGEVIVPTFDWTEYLAQFFKKVQGIKTFHHFSFNCDEPGKVTLKLLSDSVEEKLDLLRKKDTRPLRNQLPTTIKPRGLSLERRWYLYEKIREYCSQATKDLVCPYPGPGPHPVSPSPSPPPSPHPPAPLGPSVAPTPKRRNCGQCVEEGHNSRTCKKQRVRL